MIDVLRSTERGRFDFGWLDTRHSFSFGDYYDPRRLGYRSLRVINEDVVSPGRGFGMHGHRDMEIVTLMRSGVLEHRDSLGNGERLEAGELQRMTAGSGIRHSEFNPSPDVAAGLYQIWLLPERKGLPPSYEQKRFDPSARIGRWQLAASPDGRDGSLQIRQDALLWLTDLPAGTPPLGYALEAGRGAWLQVLDGRVVLETLDDSRTLDPGDGAALDGVERFTVRPDDGPVELLLFDLA